MSDNKPITLVLDKLAYASPIHSHMDPERLEREVKEAAYFAEVAEIADLRAALKSPYLARKDLSYAERKRGREILDKRLARLKANYGEPLPGAKVKPLPGPSKPTPKTRESARIEALEKGERKYTSERQCVSGHKNPLRYSSNGSCVECMAEQGALTTEKRARKKAAT